MVSQDDIKELRDLITKLGAEPRLRFIELRDVAGIEFRTSLEVLATLVRNLEEEAMWAKMECDKAVTKADEEIKHSSFVCERLASIHPSFVTSYGEIDYQAIEDRTYAAAEPDEGTPQPGRLY